MGKSQAARWLDFYDEFIATEERILSEMVEVAGNLPEDLRDSVEEADIRHLRSVLEICRCQRDLTRSIVDIGFEKN